MAVDIEKLREKEKELARAPWCPEYLYSAIRHVQRNCDFECFDHQGDAADDCNQPNRYDGRPLAAIRNAVPAMLDEIERLRAQEAVRGGDFCREARAAGRNPCGACALCVQDARARVAELEAHLEELRVQREDRLRRAPTVKDSRATLIDVCTRQAAELREAQNELETCDDVPLDQGLAAGIGAVQRDRERLGRELKAAMARLAAVAKVEEELRTREHVSMDASDAFVEAADLLAAALKGDGT